MDTSNIPEELKRLPQWLCWCYEHDPDHPDKPKKVPYSPHTGMRAKPDDVSTCGTFNEALTAISKGYYDGIGFLFTSEDEFAGVDLDNCRNPETGEIAPWAEQLIRVLDSYTEVSPSGTGAKVFMKGVLPGKGRKRYHIEIYDRNRYFIVTGQHIPGTPMETRDVG